MYQQRQQECEQLYMAEHAELEQRQSSIPTTVSGTIDNITDDDDTDISYNNI